MSWAHRARTVSEQEEVIHGASELLANQKNCDVQFNLEDGTTYGAHIPVLTSRSPVFAAMFQHDMQENRTKRIDAHDAKPEVFKTFLQYVYNGRFARMTSIDEAMDLYELADKYQVDDLKTLTVNRLSFGVTEDNAFELLRFANYFSIISLEETCMDILELTSTINKP